MPPASGRPLWSAVRAAQGQAHHVPGARRGGPAGGLWAAVGRAHVKGGRTRMGIRPPEDCGTAGYLCRATCASWVMVATTLTGCPHSQVAAGLALALGLAGFT